MSGAKLAMRRLIERIDAGETGSALVEMALVFPLLMAMLLGCVQIGVMTHCAIEATNAARAGAQYAAMNGGGYHDTSGVLAAAKADAGEFTITSAPVSSSCSCADGSSCTSSSGVYSCASGSQPVVVVTVTTFGAYPSLIKIPGLFSNNTFTLTGSAQQEVLP
jgi:Flp pilus assembly protein TadG